MTAFERESRAVLDLTERLAAAARAGEWENAAQLQGERESAMRALLDCPYEQEDVAARTAILKQLLGSETEIARLAESAHASVGAELAALRRGAGVQSAYAQVHLRE
jgi:Trp operon repressor